MSNETFDLAVIGAGPGGYVCAFRAAQLGLKVALIEKRSKLGGTCLNIGCIPSKALLASTEHLHFLKERAAAHGIVTGSVSFDLATMMRRKDAVVERITGGVSLLASKNKVQVHTGTARFASAEELILQDAQGSETTLRARHFVIATGSEPVELGALPFDGQHIVSSDQALSFTQVPETLAVIGAGAIGLELGSVWARLGSKVKVLEFLPRIAAFCDPDVSKAAQRIFQKQGLEFHLDTKATAARIEDGHVILDTESKGQANSFAVSKVLVAVGRKAFTANLQLDRAGLATDERGRIPTDGDLRTAQRHIFAIGDCTSGPMLAHKAEDEGYAVAERIATGHGHVNYDTIPSVIYTDPEIASVGITEEMARTRGRNVRIGKFPFSANGRAVAADSPEGFVKVIADASSDRLLGAQIIARGASELIAEIVTHMEYGGSAEDLGRTVHAHPTLSEAVKEAGMAAWDRPLHAL